MLFIKSGYTPIIFIKMTKTAQAESEPRSDYKLDDFVDVNSAFVGVHFIGSSTKTGKPPYELTHVFKVKVDLRWMKVWTSILLAPRPLPGVFSMRTM